MQLQKAMCLNRTIIGLKLKDGTLNEAEITGLNRTIIGLK